jgi:hypothetical protein
MSGDAKSDSAIVLSPQEAQVLDYTNVHVRSWPYDIPHGFTGLKLTVPIDEQVIGGGMHVHGFNKVFLTDSFPVDSRTWQVYPYNEEFGDVTVTLYVISLSAF